jgi:hypothetical protein
MTKGIFLKILDLQKGKFVIQLKTMKISQVILCFLALCLAFFVVLLPIMKENLGQVDAEALIFPLPTSATPAADLKATDSGALTGQTDYYLPYPGILPDHPLYWVKMARDRLTLALTQEPVARFEKLLLFSDKRLGAAEALIKGRKFSLGVSTASKGEIYLETAVGQMEKLIKEGKASAMLQDQILRASAKHIEVLSELQKEAQGDQGNLGQLLVQSEKLQQRLQQLIKK